MGEGLDKPVLPQLALNQPQKRDDYVSKAFFALILAAAAGDKDRVYNIALKIVKHIYQQVGEL